MARILSAISQVKRRAIEITARPGVDKLGPSGNAREWRDVRYARQRAPKQDHQYKKILPLKTTLSRSVSTEGARDLRGGATAGLTHTTGDVSGIKASHHQENKFYLLTKVKSSNKQTKNINTSYNKQTTCKTLRRPQNETKAADCGLFK